MINGPIPYSADADFVMGKVPELDNYYVATGFLYGIAAGGGAGKMMAEWILEGRPSLDLWPLDVRRFAFHHTTHHFMGSRMVELYAHHYKLAAPGTEHITSRGVKRSPLHDSLAGQGAVFGSRGGWERPNWFAPAGVEAVDRPSFGEPNWFPHVAEEHRAVRERVALIDQTSFAKFEITGPGALDAVQWLSVADMDKPVGTVTYTQLCNRARRHRVRPDDDPTRRRALVRGHRFGVRRARHGLDPLELARRRQRADPRPHVGVRGHQPVWADGARGLADRQRGRCLERCAALRDGARHHYRRCSCVGNARRVRRRTGLGAARAHLVCSARLRPAARRGREYGIANVGYRAIDTLRMEKGYLYWSTDITPDTTPWEAGLGWRVNMRKGDFCGRDALEAQRESGVTRKLCTFTLEQMAYPVSGEAIIADGEVVGFTTSANFGHTIGKPIATGYVPIEFTDRTDFVIEVYGEPIPATRHDGALYDPKNLRLKS